MAHTGPDVLRIEAQAVLEAADRLDVEAFATAVRLLRDTTGTVHVLGSGKSGIVGRKLASTLSSTGTPAAFLHPSDAMHGDLGAVVAGDVAVALSNSGETEEVLAALPYLLARGVPVIAVVGETGSTLARRATAVLDAHAAVEACPLGLAPTTSTTVALALCDALAVVVMQEKGVTQDAFARNHPSGRLGRRLTLTVRDLLRDDVAPVSPDDGFLDVVDAIGKGGVGAAPVVELAALAGIVTDGDVRRALERHALEDLRELRVRTMMTSSPVTTSPDALAYDAMRLMEDRPSQITVLPVVDADGGVLGVLRLHDLVRAGL
jgi:arabinose-5-phosphate isomerase